MQAAKQGTRRVQARRRTTPIVTQDWAGHPQTVADWALCVVAALTLSGVLPMLAAAGLIEFTENVLPGWAQLPFSMGLALAAMWAFVRVGITGSLR